MDRLLLIAGGAVLLWALLKKQQRYVSVSQPQPAASVVLPSQTVEQQLRQAQLPYAQPRVVQRNGQSYITVGNVALPLETVLGPMVGQGRI